MPRQNWSREELIVAFNLYCKLPFGHYHGRHPRVIELARLLGRTSGAVAMKLCNFASFDPTHQRRGIRGLRHAGKADQDIWDEFNGNWEGLAVESEEAYLRLKGEEPEEAVRGASTEVEDTLAALLPASEEETEREQLVNVRLRQSFFRQTVLASYESRCCVCRLPCEALLIASHIIPWAQRPDLRVNPRNGLCLCALHDRAFDRGLLAVEPTFVICVSTRLERYLPQEVVEQMFIRFRATSISLPEKFKPEPDFLTYHFANIFQPAQAV
jgi:putative restriction endonuclease